MSFDGQLPRNFLSLPPELSSIENSKVVILPVPYDGTVTYVPGTRNGPAAILEASKYVEWYDPLLEKEPCQTGIHTMPSLEPVCSPEDMIKKVKYTTSNILSQQKFPFIIGGEHSISYGVFKAIHEIHGGVTVVQLDAHADQRDMYEGTRFNHACVMRRLSSLAKYVGIGIRSMSLEEAQWIKNNRFPCLPPKVFENKENLKQAIGSVLNNPVYLTIDLDVLDPSVMPSVGTPEPGGITWDDLLWILGWITRNYQVVGCDIVELCPIPGLIAPDFLAAKLVNHIIGLVF